MTAKATSPARTLITSRRPFEPSTDNKSGGTYTVKGIDTTDSRVFAVDAGAGQLKQSSDWASTWSSSKGLPTDVAWSAVAKIVRFGDYLYMLALDGGTSRGGVYRAAPASGNNAFTWSSQLVTFAASATCFGTNLSTDGTYLYAAEYGTPSGGPSLYRSANGTDWTTVLGPQATWLHIHAVEPDPFNAGHVWLTAGDGVTTPIMYSTDSGSNWTEIPQQSSYTPQCVGIGFSRSWVVMAADAEYATVVVIDRDTKTWRYGCTNSHFNVAIPGSTDTFDPSPFYLAVDQSTSIAYISIPTNGSHATAGLFVLPRVGGRVELLTYGEAGGLSFIANGYLWAGNYNRRLWTIEQTQ